MDKQASGEQPKALAMAVLAAAQNIDNLEAILLFRRKAYNEVDKQFHLILRTNNLVKLSLFYPF